MSPSQTCAGATEPPELLLGHSLLYALARGLPGLVNLAAIAVYTRVLAPADYGAYSLVLAGVALIDAIGFQWLRLGLLRFLPQAATTGNSQGERALLRLINTLYALSAILLLALAFALAPFAAGSVPVGLLLAGAGLLVTQGWFELNLELVRSSLSPRRYGLLAATRAVLSLALGSALAVLWGAAGLVLGLGLGIVLSLLLLREYRAWPAPALAALDNRSTAKNLLTYGLPLAATLALGLVVGLSDRFLLGWLLGAEATGLYAVGYDLSQFSVTMLLSIINLAAYPLTVRALEEGGAGAARRSLSDTLFLLVGLGLPASAGIALLATPLAGFLIGPEFVTTAAAVIPWIAFAALIAGIKAFFVDVGFQLGRNTVPQAWVMLLAAVLNVALNLLLIPRWGIMGAVWSTVAVYAFALLLSLVLVRRSFPLPGPTRDVAGIVLAAAGMSGLLLWLPEPQGAWPLIAHIAAGAAAYLVLVVALVPRARQLLLRFTEKL